MVVVIKTVAMAFSSKKISALRLFESSNGQFIKPDNRIISI